MSSNNVGHLITSTITTLQHFATLNHTSPNYTSLHLSTLHFLSFITLHYSPIRLNPSTFPIVLFHLPSLNYTQYGSHIPKLISKVMNPFTALKNFSPCHFIYIFFSLILSTLHFTLLYCSHIQLQSLHFPCLHFFIFIAFTSPTVLHFPNPRFENRTFTVGSPDRPFR
jgi:hypothetical protein